VAHAVISAMITGGTATATIATTTGIAITITARLSREAAIQSLAAELLNSDSDRKECSMLRLPIVALIAAFSGSVAIAGPIPWFHTRPKPVIIEEPAPAPVTRVAYHGTAVYPKTGRLFFDDSRDRIKSAQSQQSGFHLPDVFPLNLLNSPQANKSSSARSK
jgi:hypothetical protein